ncbi:MAG: nucleotidyltransferase domain-containing protein [Candidatus Parvarchaeota archaeon]|nr:nucleotidyltransferase domain-containing protein [Candidatus Parvarchaeota archaeon]
MEGMESVFNQSRRRFVPSFMEKLEMERAEKKIIELLKANIDKRKIKADLKVAGSYAKGTWIRGESDIDIFVLFDSEEDTKLLSQIVPKSFKAERGTRRYFRGRINGIDVEVVPLVKFDRLEDVKNSIDLSVLHIDYVNSHSSEQQKKDIIILKRFCQANDCYGSETYKHGFSGYVLELLILKYGSIKGLFDAVLNWKDNEFIDLEGFYKSRSEAVSSIGAKDNHLIIVDPTNRRRNVCGSLSLENLSKFVLAVKQFAFKPSMRFFETKNLEAESKRMSKSRGTKLFETKLRIEGPRDMFLSKLSSRLRDLIEELQREDIQVYSHRIIEREKEAKVLIEIGNVPTTKTRRISGPSVWLNYKDLSNFFKKHRDVYAADDKISYDLNYPFKDVNKFIYSRIKSILKSA